GPLSVHSRPAAPSGFPTSRLATTNAARSIGPAGGIPTRWYPSRPRSWTVVRSPGSMTASPLTARPTPRAAGRRRSSRRPGRPARSGRAPTGRRVEPATWRDGGPRVQPRDRPADRARRPRGLRGARPPSRCGLDARAVGARGHLVGDRPELVGVDRPEPDAIPGPQEDRVRGGRIVEPQRRPPQHPEP